MAIHHRPTGAVLTLSQDDHPALARTLEQGLIESRDNEIMALMSSKDWPDFERRRGTVNGFNAAISLCKEVQRRLGS